jgi:hypothetical protein
VYKKSKTLEKKTAKKIIPVKNSTAGYCHEIRLLQEEHFPLKNKKLHTGTSSYQESFLPHAKHLERPEKMDKPVP